MANVEGLTFRKTGKHSGTWYYRLSVPERHREVAQCEDIWVSLRTSDKSKALASLSIAKQTAESKLAQKLSAATTPSSDLVGRETFDLRDLSSRLSKAQYAAVRDADIANRVTLFEMAVADEQAFYRGKLVCLPATPYMSYLLEDPESELSAALSHYWSQFYGDRIARLERALTAGDLSEGSKALDALLGGLGVEVATPKERTRLAHRAMLAEVRALRDILANDDLHASEIEASAKFVRREKVAEHPGLPRFSEAAKRWIEEKTRAGWSARRKDACESTARLFVEVVGDRLINAYTKTDTRNFKSMLADLPPNRSKLRQTRGLGVSEAAKRARELKLPKMSTTNINKQLTILSAIFEWSRGHYDGFDANPLANARIAQRSNARDQRDPFSVQDLELIFQAPVFTGCHSEAHWKLKGPHVLRGSAKFWLPLLGLYTGARLNELCKLRIADIRVKDGVTYFDINDEAHSDKIDPGLKSHSSKRQIPVHADLISFGFVEFCNARKNAGAERLFPELLPDKYGKLSGGFGKHFARFLKSIALKRPKLDFHSFRHTWTDACRNSRLPNEIIYALKGEALKGTLARYGDGRTDLEILGEYTEAIEFRGLDLSRLSPKIGPTPI